ncbi:hypothetical protein C8A03DRAFT_37860, partial [Achaetomium macrosporum]
MAKRNNPQKDKSKFIPRKCGDHSGGFVQPFVPGTLVVISLPANASASTRRGFALHTALEYCRVQQRQFDLGETLEERIANETKAVYEEQFRRTEAYATAGITVE